MNYGGGSELWWKGVTQDWAPELELGDVKAKKRLKQMFTEAENKSLEESFAK